MDQLLTLLEQKFSIRNKSDDSLRNIYEIFKDSYIKSTGTSWDYEKFIDRSFNWDFWGDDKGFVTTRVQKNGAIKLVGVAGSHISAYKGLKELLSSNPNTPIWGMVSDDIATQLSKIGFIRPPAFLIKMIIPKIPASVWGGVPASVQNDGGIKFSYEDVGEALKYFVATKSYYKWAFEEIINKEQIPSLLKIPLNLFKKTIFEHIVYNGLIYIESTEVKGNFSKMTLDFLKDIGKENLITSRNTIVLFHGTSTTNAENILKQKKFKGFPWFAVDREVAERYAKTKVSNPSKITVLELEIDPDSVLPSGNSYLSARKEGLTLNGWSSNNNIWHLPESSDSFNH